MRFGLYLDTFCDEIKYDFKFDGKKPDWTIKLNGQKIIAEVLRLNVEEAELAEIFESNERARIYNQEN